MLSLLTALILACVATLFIINWYHALSQVPKGLKELPGPTGYPLIGSLLDFPKTYSYRKLAEWADRYGGICKVNILGQTHIVISDVEIANDLLALRGAMYSDRPKTVMYGELVTHNGALAASPPNKYWRNARKLAGARLSSSALEPWDSVLLEEAARLVCDLVITTQNYEYLFERYSAVVMLQILYGKKISRKPQEPQHIKQVSAINRTLEKCTAPGAYLVDFLPVLKYLPDFLAP